MVFTLVSSAQEWLNVKWDDIRKERDEEKTRRVKEEEEAERVIENECARNVFILHSFRNALKALGLQ